MPVLIRLSGPVKHDCIKQYSSKANENTDVKSECIEKLAHLAGQSKQHQNVVSKVLCLAHYIKQDDHYEADQSTHQVLYFVFPFDL